MVYPLVCVSCDCKRVQLIVLIRLRRYFKPANGRSNASKEAAAMFEDKEKRIMAAFRMAQQDMICTYDLDMAPLISKESNWQPSSRRKAR